MNPEIKARWITALRFGKYRQTSRKLRAADSFCVLGVLCDIVDPTGWRREDSGAFTYFGNRTHIISEIIDRINLSDALAENVTIMNDRERKSFTEIADYIESQDEAKMEYIF